MELFLFNRFEYDRLYNCSAYDVNQIPFEKRQRLWLGIAFLLLGVICEILYIPCMIAIRKHMDSTCYKFMFYISIADMLCLIMCAIITGYLAVVGAVFCSAPTFIYISGAFGLALWACETMAEMILAINRCFELLSPTYLAPLLFHGNILPLLWMVVPTLYGLYFFFCQKPLCFSGLYLTWFNNPHFGYIDDYDVVYHNNLQTAHNYIVITVLSGTYLTFAMILCAKGRKTLRADTSTGAAPQKRVFLQVVLISSVNAIAAAIYVYMNFVQLSEVLIIFGQFCWVMAHGIPPIIYLLLNKTVRRDVYVMFARPLSHVFTCVKVPTQFSSVVHPSAAIGRSAVPTAVKSASNARVTPMLTQKQ